MLLGEASRWEPLYTLNSGTNYSYVIQNYFDETYNSGKYYLGDLKHVPKILCAHSYHTDKTWSSLKSAREKAYEKANQCI